MRVFEFLIAWVVGYFSVFGLLRTEVVLFLYLEFGFGDLVLVETLFSKLYFGSFIGFWCIDVWVGFRFLRDVVIIKFKDAEGSG